jgi:cytochrome c-type biogenesis protein CcmE
MGVAAPPGESSADGLYAQPPLVPVPAAVAAAGVRRRAGLGGRRRQVIAGLLIVAALGFLLSRGLSNATEFFKTTGEAVAQRAQLGTHEFRIEGTVMPGVSQVGGAVHFEIVNGTVVVRVVSQNSPPQLFKAGVPVVLDGHWQGTTYLSDLIMVKHSASYVAAHPDRVKGQTIPAPGSTSSAQ